MTNSIEIICESLELLVCESAVTHCSLQSFNSENFFPPKYQNLQLLKEGVASHYNVVFFLP